MHAPWAATPACCTGALQCSPGVGGMGVGRVGAWPLTCLLHGLALRIFNLNVWPFWFTLPAALLHCSGKPDEWMDEIPTVVVDSLPPDLAAVAAVGAGQTLCLVVQPAEGPVALFRLRPLCPPPPRPPVPNVTSCRMYALRGPC